jgi:2-iminobutanoate/2-iminopropanoate deaminase
VNTIATDAAPAAIGPYSQALEHDGLVFCSGQIALDPGTMQVVGEEIAAQTEQVFRNIRAVLEAADLSLSTVIKTTVFLADMKDFPEMNRVYGKAFGAHKPARSTVEAARLPKDVLVEIECIAVR